MKPVQLNYRLTEIRDTRHNFKGIEEVDMPSTLLADIFINNYLIMVGNNLTKYNSHIQSLFKIANLGKSEQGLVLCEGSGVTVYVQKDSRHRHWLGIINNGELGKFRLGSRGTYFTTSIIREIREQFVCFTEEVVDEVERLLSQRVFTEGFGKLKRPGWFKRLFQYTGSVPIPGANLKDMFMVTVGYTHPFRADSEYRIQLYKQGGFISSHTLSSSAMSEIRVVSQEVLGEMTEAELATIINNHQARMICSCN